MFLQRKMYQKIHEDMAKLRGNRVNVLMIKLVVTYAQSAYEIRRFFIPFAKIHGVVITFRAELWEF
jgi:hypothetical protein